MAENKYWQNFGEYNNSRQEEDEFKQDLPSDIQEEIPTGSTSRRDFLKYLGFSTAAAAVAASCESPVRKAIPFVNKPQDVIPGVADYYATTFINGGEAIPIVAKVRDGRPIKIEGNTLCTYTKGGTSARAQASVLDLYDTARLRFPSANGTAVSLRAIDKMVMDGIMALSGASVVLLTSTITSPSTKQIVSQFLAKFPGSRHVQYDPISYSGMLLANEATYGKRGIPSFHFENAKVIVGLSADFLGSWLNPVEYQRGYSRGRKVTGSNVEMSKHYQFESMMSMTGANADDRFTHKPSESGAVAVALLNAVSGQAVTGITNQKLMAGIDKAAKDLLANKGKSLVVSGSNNQGIQTIVNAINEAIGANGTTIDWTASLQTKQGIDSEFATLVSDMETGRVGGLIVSDVNPAYDYFDAKRFSDALKKLKLSVSLNQKSDETGELCKYLIPSHHYLESWGDAEPKAGYFSLLQPTISPLFITRQFQESLLIWSGNNSTYEAYHKKFWIGKLGSEDLFNKALQDGIVEPASPSMSSGGFNAGSVSAAVAAVTSSQKPAKTELILYQNIFIGEGRQSNNPWLLEMPDPITRADWDNYVLVSPKIGRELLDIDISRQRAADEYEVHTKKPVIRVTVRNKQIELPALIVPGMQDDTIAIAVGYGRKSASGTDEDTAKNIGRAVIGVGKNAFGFAAYNGSTIEWNVGEASISKTGDRYKIAQVQTHSSYEGRHDVVKEMTLNEFKEHPSLVHDEREKELEPWGGLSAYDSVGTLYPTKMMRHPGIQWGMSIDLNSCFGCGACVVACSAENNVPVVGKSEVLRFHDMHWLRIDRYFSGDPNDPESIQTIFQPMLCQHCDNAPCENVCPVAATNHNSEGINQMIYNRCIGTRYCANNCPYKVRRFNWADYTGADSFPNNQKGSVDDSVMMMNDDLTRMVLNPDVTVRSRGVIEKCSFCVQRLQEGKLKAKKENRLLNDSDAQTACAQACPTEAIVFGNAKNAESVVSKTRSENMDRLYYVLEPLHTLPNVSYLAKVRNTEVLSAHEGDEEIKVQNDPAKKVDPHR